MHIAVFRGVFRTQLNSILQQEITKKKLAIQKEETSNPPGKCMFKVYNKGTTCLKSTIGTPEQYAKSAQR